MASTADRPKGPKKQAEWQDAVLDTADQVDASGEEIEAELVLLKQVMQSLDNKTPDTAVDLAQGRLFTAGGKVVVPQAGAGCFRLFNPAASGKVFTVHQFTLGANALTEVLYYTQSTLSSPTAITVFNNNLASAVTSAATVQSSATARVGGTQLSPVGLLANGAPEQTAFNMVIPPGASVTLQVSTTALQSLNFYASATWSEDPV